MGSLFRSLKRIDCCETNRIVSGQMFGMYVMGENPAMSDPDQNHARTALSKLQHLVVQDIFFTETAWLLMLSFQLLST